MTEAEYRKWASVYSNGDFYIALTNSGYRSCVRDPIGCEDHLGLGATDEELGKAVLEAIAQSRFLRPERREEFEQFFNPARIAASYATWVSSLLARYKYKTKRDFFKHMALCNITVSGDKMEISPTRHEKLESWGREENDGLEDVLLAASSTPEDVGKALRIAFSRCE